MLGFSQGDEEKKEEVEEEKKEEEDLQPSTLAKTQSGEEEVSVVTSQKEITLAEDLDKRDRLDIYKNFLLYCMQGDVVTLPMGGTMVVERDQSEFQRLGNLGDVLGLNQMDVMEVHSVSEGLPRKPSKTLPLQPSAAPCPIPEVAGPEI